MAFSVVMPALEMAQETGKLIAWRKQEGDHVTKGEPLLEIETDKAVMEVEATADGILAGITGLVGADIPVGQTIAWIVAPGEKPPVEAESSTERAHCASQFPGTRGIAGSGGNQCCNQCCSDRRRSEREDFSESATPGERVGGRYRRSARVWAGR